MIRCALRSTLLTIGASAHSRPRTYDGCGPVHHGGGTSRLSTETSFVAGGPNVTDAGLDTAGTTGSLLAPETPVTPRDRSPASTPIISERTAPITPRAPPPAAPTAPTIPPIAVGVRRRPSAYALLTPLGYDRESFTTSTHASRTIIRRIGENLAAIHGSIIAEQLYLIPNLRYVHRFLIIRLRPLSHIKIGCHTARFEPAPPFRKARAYTTRPMCDCTCMTSYVARTP